VIEIRPDQLDANGMRKTLVLHQDAEPPPPVVTPAGEFQGRATAKLDEFSPVKVGGKVDGFEVVDALAEGGMGAVFRVKDRDGQRELALKAPLPDGRGGTYTHRMRRFLREVRLSQRMDHPGVAKVVEVGQQDGLPYFTMELVEGTAFSDKMFQGDLSVADAVSIIESAARGVHHIHQKGVIHRDLKPQNILVKRSGEVVIIDFGLARDTNGIDPRITQEGVWLGTPAYIAPEQAQGEASSVDARADVYSLGAVLYEAITGAPPYGSGNTRQIFKNLKTKTAEPVRFHRPECPESVDRVVMKALAKNRENRYATALEFAEALLLVRRDIAALPALKVHTSLERPVADLDALESVLVDKTSPILRSRPKKEGRVGDDSRRAQKNVDAGAETAEVLAVAPSVLEAHGWKDLGTSDAHRAAPGLIPIEKTEKKGSGRNRGDKGHHSRRLRELVAAANGRKQLLVLGGPALLAICGLLLLLL
jgi:serine/threonine protein kinase